jgi:acetyltransferase-like isoleucine patch superfamily enzyme
MQVRKIILILIALMPNIVKIFLYKKILGYKIGCNVKIGFSYLDASNAIIEDNVIIGHFNLIKEINKLLIGQNSFIGNFNQCFGGSRRNNNWSSELIIGKKCSIMSHHFMDITGNIFIDNNTIIGGRDTHFWSHSLVNQSHSLKRIPLNINIGKNVYVGARATLVGCNIPDFSIVGAGSVVTKAFASDNNRNCILIAGNPARVKKKYEN